MFHTRLEWDDHKLSADHLRKVGEQRRQFNPDLKDDEFELLDVIIIEDEEDELPVASQTQMLQNLEMKDADDQEEENVVASSDAENIEDENKLEAINDDEKDKETDIKEEENSTTKEDSSVIEKEKDEKPVNVVGRELVVKTGGFVCRICSVFMKNEDEADLHCQTATHYINLTSITKLHVS